MTRSSGADAGLHRADLFKDRCHPCSPDVGAGPGCLRGLGGTWRPRAAGVRRGVWGRGRLGRGARSGRHGARRPEEGGARRRGRHGEVRARSVNRDERGVRWPAGVTCGRARGLGAAAARVALTAREPAADPGGAGSPRAIGVGPARSGGAPWRVLPPALGRVRHRVRATPAEAGQDPSARVEGPHDPRRPHPAPGRRPPADASRPERVQPAETGSARSMPRTARSTPGRPWSRRLRGAGTVADRPIAEKASGDALPEHGRWPAGGVGGGGGIAIVVHAP